MESHPKANKGGISPMAAWEGVKNLKIPSKLMKAPFCLVYVLLFEEERRKNDARTYAAMFLGPQLPHGGFVVRSLQNFKFTTCPRFMFTRSPSHT